MEFSNYNLENLKQFTKHTKDYHDIKNYHKMNKEQLAKELSDRFTIDGGSLLVTGGSKESSYIQKLEAKKEITRESFKKIKKPSRDLVRKYGQQEEPPHALVEEPPKSNRFKKNDEPITASAPVVEPIFDEAEILHFDVSKSKKKNHNKKDKLSDEEADKLANQKEKDSVEAQKRKSLQNRYQKIEKQIVEYINNSTEMKNIYTDDLEKLKKLRQTKPNKLLYEIRIKRFSQDKKNLMQQYKALFEYIEKNKLNRSNMQSVLELVQYQLCRL
jgi:hypothetical protein